MYLRMQAFPTQDLGPRRLAGEAASCSMHFITRVVAFTLAVINFGKSPVVNAFGMHAVSGRCSAVDQPSAEPVLEYLGTWSLPFYCDSVWLAV